LARAAVALKAVDLTMVFAREFAQEVVRKHDRRPAHAGAGGGMSR
jgi:hypothetical protein